MADSWIFWLGCIVGPTLMALLALAGMPIAGAFLGAVVILSARAALAPEARLRVDEDLRQLRDRMRF